MSVAKSLLQLFSQHKEPEAYVQNALHDLEDLRSGIVDGLTSPNDLYLRAQLLSSADAAIGNLKRALL